MYIQKKPNVYTLDIMKMLRLALRRRTPPLINAYVYHTVSQDHEMGADQNSRHLRIFLDFFMIFSCFFHFFTLKNSFSWLEMAFTPCIHAKNREEPKKLGPKKLQSQQLGKKRKKLQKFNFFHNFGCFSPWPTARPTDGPTDGDEKCSNNNSNTNMHAQTHTCILFQFLIDMTNRPTDARTDRRMDGWINHPTHHSSICPLVQPSLYFSFFHICCLFFFVCVCKMMNVIADMPGPKYD